LLDSFVQAAGRHLQDAKLLLEHERWDNAVYLSGYDEQDRSVRIKKADINKLEYYLKQKLGSYYGEDIWLPEGDKDGYKALITEIKQCRIAAEWKNNDIDTEFYILERHIAKKAWTNNNNSRTLPWPVELVDRGHKPAIITFFSFKGGVGRTTALAATALTLSRKGHRVAIVDLDLEAPGVSTIFFPDNLHKFGVIDYLLEKKIQKDNWSLRDHIQPINDLLLYGDSGEILRLVPEGTVDNSYLEKLARLDFQNLVHRELPETFQDMLEELSNEVQQLDFILLDSRAGFHDIGGLALTDLSHGSVIFSTQSRQSWAGMTQVIRRLSQTFENQQTSEQIPLILVHAMGPNLSERGRLGNEEVKRFKDKAYEIFRENYYSEQDTVPDIDDSDAPFTPIIIPFQNDLRGDISLFVSQDLEKIIHALDLLDEKLTETDEWLFVTYDELDRLVTSYNDLVPPIRELLAFWLDRWRRWKRIRPKIFLRTDLFREEFLGFPDASKLRGHQTNLEWKYTWLYQLLWKRLANSGQEMAEYLRLVPNLIIDNNTDLGIMVSTNESLY